MTSTVGTEAHWDRIRAEHPGLAGKAYLNTATFGCMAHATAQHATRVQQELLEQGAPRLMDWLERGLHEAAAVVAKSIAAAPGSIALVPNFSYGAAMLAPLLAHRPKVLMVKGDYPTLMAPFKQAPFQAVQIEAEQNGAIPLTALEAALDRERPAILAISHVQWATGFTVDLQGVAALSRTYGALSVIDITQSWGCLPIDVQGMGLDVVGGSGYKWPLAGLGNGAMFVSDQVRDEIKERSGGEALQLIARGHTDPVAFSRLQHALERYMAIGPEAIASRVEALCTYAVEALDGIGVQVLSGRSAEGRAGILIIEGDAHRLDRLSRSGVSAMLRGAGIRIGIHYYNTQADIDSLVEALKG